MGQNSGLKLLAFVIALILWAYVRITLGGFGQSKVTQLEMRVPLELRGETSLLPYERSVDTIEVTVKGDSRIVDSLKGGLVSAFVVLDDMQAGTQFPEVQVVVPAGIQILKKEPASVSLSLSPYMVKEVPVKVATQGKAKSGYNVGVPSVAPETVKLEGPEALLTQVVAVNAKVPLENREKSFSVQVHSLEAINENDTAVMGTGRSIRFSPKEVTALIPVERAEELLNLPVILDRVNFEPKPGYSYETVVEPKIVLVGSRLPEGVEPPTNLSTESITFPSSTKPQSREVFLAPVEGLEFKGTEKVTVKLIPTRIAQPKPTASPK